MFGEPKNIISSVYQEVDTNVDNMLKQYIAERTANRANKQAQIDAIPVIQVPKQPTEVNGVRLAPGSTPVKGPLIKKIMALGDNYQEKDLKYLSVAALNRIHDLESKKTSPSEEKYLKIKPVIRKKESPLEEPKIQMTIQEEKEVPKVPEINHLERQQQPRACSERPDLCKLNNYISYLRALVDMCQMTLDHISESPLIKK